MNPNGGERGPQIEFAPEQQNRGENDSPQTEKAGAVNPENSAQRQSLQTSSQIASDLAVPTSASVPTQADDVATAGAKATTSTGSDRIEKEWIDKAKDIIAKTQDDPFEQKEAMSRVKADYIKKRFNKTIKTDKSLK